MPTGDSGSYFRTRTIAQCFVETATLLYNTSLKESPRRQPLLIVPFVVNASFACELFLKALAHRGGVSLRGHNLPELLAALPVQERQRLDEAWTAAANLISNEVPEILESVVNKLSNSFVDWRYSHEKDRLSTASCSSILLLLEVFESASQYSSDA